MTRQLRTFNRDLQKPCSPDTDGYKSYRLAVVRNAPHGLKRTTTITYDMTTNLTCPLVHRLAPTQACIWQFTVLFLKFTKPAHERHLQALKGP
jgi:hypothetical protein